MIQKQIQKNLEKLLVERPYLAETLTRLNQSGIRYGLCAGVHVMLLTNTREHKDVDILIHSDDYEKTRDVFPEAQMREIGNGTMLVLGDGHDVELMGFADFFIEDSTYTFRLTDTALEKLHVYDCGEIRVPLVDPADTILLKAILQRGAEEGKCDHEDIRAITTTVDIDTDYLCRRIEESAPCSQRIKEFLTPLGVSV